MILMNCAPRHWLSECVQSRKRVLNGDQRVITSRHTQTEICDFFAYRDAIEVFETNERHADDKRTTMKWCV